MFMRRVNGWFTVFWIVMIPVSIATHWISSVSHVITEFALPHPEGDCIFLRGIAAVSGQAMAFTYADGVTGESLVGRITTTGTISTLPTPTPESFPSGITSGPNGSVWFTEVGGPSVAGVTRRGSVSPR